MIHRRLAGRTAARVVRLTDALFKRDALERAEAGEGGLGYIEADERGEDQPAFIHEMSGRDGSIVRYRVSDPMVKDLCHIVCEKVPRDSKAVLSPRC